MAYSDFNLSKFKKAFNFQIDEEADLFADVEAIQPSETLKATLAETIELGLAINTDETGHDITKDFQS